MSSFQQEELSLIKTINQFKNKMKSNSIVIFIVTLQVTGLFSAALDNVDLEQPIINLPVDLSTRNLAVLCLSLPGYTMLEGKCVCIAGMSGLISLCKNPCGTEFVTLPNGVCFPVSI